MTTRRHPQQAANYLYSAENEEELYRRMADLRLPRMPVMPVMPSTSASPEEAVFSILNGEDPSPRPTRNGVPTPTIRILVVADIDLRSASALAEAALGSDGYSSPLLSTASPRSNRNRKNNDHRYTNENAIDLCIACGPFCHEDDLHSYYQGRQRRRHLMRHPNMACHSSSKAAPIWTSTTSTSASSTPQYLQLPTQLSSSIHSTNSIKANAKTPLPTPYKRSPEETAAMEGIMTAALSQLESIVCRVVYCPGPTDPITTMTSTGSKNVITSTTTTTTTTKSQATPSSQSSLRHLKERRLTPNSRNVHQRWMPLCPGLGCAGLLYADTQRINEPPLPYDDDEVSKDDDDDDDDDDDIEDSSSEDYSDEQQGSDASNSIQMPSDADPNRRSSMPSLTGHPGSPSSSSNILQTTEGLNHMEDYCVRFQQQVEQLVQRAPLIMDRNNSTTTDTSSLLQGTSRHQTIMITHFQPPILPNIENVQKNSTINYGGGCSKDDNVDHIAKTHTAAAELIDTSDKKLITDFEGLSMKENSDCQDVFDDDNNNKNNNYHDDREPWPCATKHHSQWTSSTETQEHVVLEIAAGWANVKGNNHTNGKNSENAANQSVGHNVNVDTNASQITGNERRNRNPKRIPILMPESLRKTGTYAIVTIGLVPMASGTGISRVANQKNEKDEDCTRADDPNFLFNYEWQVIKTETNQLPDYL